MMLLLVTFQYASLIKTAFPIFKCTDTCRDIALMPVLGIAVARHGWTTDIGSTARRGERTEALHS